MADKSAIQIDTTEGLAEISEYVYLGRRACGCAVSFVFDDPDDPKWTGKTVAEFIRDGLTVERVHVSVSRRDLRVCKCTPSKVR